MCVLNSCPLPLVRWLVPGLIFPGTSGSQLDDNSLLFMILTFIMNIFKQNKNEQCNQLHVYISPNRIVTNILLSIPPENLAELIHRHQDIKLLNTMRKWGYFLPQPQHYYRTYKLAVISFCHVILNLHSTFSLSSKCLFTVNLVESGFKPSPHTAFGVDALDWLFTCSFDLVSIAWPQGYRQV